MQFQWKSLKLKKNTNNKIFCNVFFLSVLAEEFHSSKQKYEEEAKKSTEMHAKSSVDELEKVILKQQLKNYTLGTNLYWHRHI